MSRIIDVLVAERDAGRNDFIDPTAIGVTGCSRLGKGAFTIGAFDERIALGIPQESGTGGVSAFRVVNTNPMGPNSKAAQSLDSAWSEAQGWFGTVFQMYKDDVDVIPVDTHSLVAMYAPRGLLVLDNSRIGELSDGVPSARRATVRSTRRRRTRKAPADGRIAPAAIATADLTQWVDWTPPTLQ